MQDLPAIVIDTGVTTSIVLFLCAGAMVLARFLTLEQIPQMWAEQIFGLVKDKWVFIIIINLFLLRYRMPSGLSFCHSDPDAYF